MTKSPREDVMTAKQQYDEIGVEADTAPLERLRFFCSLAMNGQDWLDVEPFFAALESSETEQCAMCDSKNIDRQRTKTICRDCGAETADLPQSQEALIVHLKSLLETERKDTVPRELSYQQAIRESIGSILSDYAAEKILERADEIHAANNPETP